MCIRDSSIVSASNGNISITPNGSGKIILDGLSFPTADGSADTVLKTDGSGNLAFSSVSALSGSGIQQVQDDTSPVLGGNLNANSNQISNVSAIAVGQSSFSGGGVLADFHASGSGVGSQLAFTNDHNTSKFYVGLEGNTTGNALIYQSKDADINFYTNNNLRMTLDNSGNLILDDGNIILPQTGVLAFNSTADEYITATASNMYIGVDNGWVMQLDGANNVVNIREGHDLDIFNGDLYASSDIFLKGGSPTYTTTYTATGHGTPLNISSSTGYVGMTFEATGSSANTWQLYASGTGSNKFTGMYDRTGGYYVNLFYKDGRVDLGNGRATVSTQGNLAVASVNTGLINDSDNTAYYVNPNGSSVMYSVYTGGTLSAGTTNTLNSAGQIGIYRNSSPYISFHDSTLDRTAYIQESGGAFYLWEATFTEMSGQARAPIFYDSNNTSYYVDPASTTNIYSLIATNYIYTPIVYDNNNSGYYVDPYSTSVLNNVNMYGALQFVGNAGTSGQVLTSNGNNVPSWQDAGGGAWEVIGNYTGTNVNSVDFLNGVNNFVWNNSTYKRIKLYGNIVGYAHRTSLVNFYPLVSSGSSGNVIPTSNVMYVDHWIESYPEYSVTLTTGSHHYIYQSTGNNNNSGVMFRVQCGSLPNSSGGIGMFGDTIGGTYYGSNKRKLDSSVIAEWDALGLGTDKTFSWRVTVSHDYPSFYFYPRQIQGQTLSHGWTNQGIRVAGSNTSSTFNYDFTFIGLKP